MLVDEMPSALGDRLGLARMRTAAVEITGEVCH